MFRRMQLRLALVFSLILVVILVASSSAVYFVLAAYNESQILDETNRMIASISETEWIEESYLEEDHLIDGIPEDGEYSGFEIYLEHETKDDDSDESSEDSRDDRNINSDSQEDDIRENQEDTRTEDSDNTSESEDTEEIEDTEDTEDTEDVEDTEDAEDKEDGEDKKDTEEIEQEEGGKDKEEEIKVEDEKDEEDEEEDESDDIGYGGSPFGSLAAGPLGRPFMALSQTQESETEIYGAGGQELIIPGTFDAFSFYFIYDVNGNLLKWKSDFNEWNDILAEKSKSMTVKDQPEVFRVDEADKVAFIMQKLPIVLDNETVGYYTVGRDVSIVDQTLDNLLLILIASLGFGILASAGIGYLIAGRMIKPIKEAYFSKQRFLADASHELRTPISVVLLSCDTLDEGGMIEDDFGKEVVTGIRSETNRMKDLVERLLNLARYDAGTAKFSKEALDLGQVLDANRDSYQHIGARKGIQIELDREDFLKVNGDKQLLNSLISILVDNAIKYNHEGGKVMIGARKIKEKKKGYIEVTIEDTGKGIPKEDLKSIFTRFYRVDKSRGKEIEGHGLGLSIAKEVVNLHKGRIMVDSHEGSGTIFTVILPEID